MELFKIHLFSIVVPYINDCNNIYISDDGTYVYCEMSNIHQKQNIGTKPGKFEKDKNGKIILRKVNVPIDKELFKISTVADNLSKVYKAYITLNTDMLENMINEGVNISERNKLFDVLQKIYSQKCEKYVNNLLGTTYDYEMNNIPQWMIENENQEVDEYYCFDGNILTINKTNNCVIDVERGITYASNDNLLTKYKIKGGIVINEMRYRIYDNISKLIENNKLSSNFFKRRETKKIDGLQIITSISKIIADTLIICPDYLCVQWKAMLSKKFNNIVMISTKRDHEKYTYNDVYNADAVIITHNYFFGKNYKKLFKSYKISESSSLQNCMKAMNLEYIRNKHLKEIKSPIISHFFWNRIILDEYPDTSTMHQNELLKTISSRSKWYMNRMLPSTSDEILKILDFVLYSPESKSYYEEGKNNYQIYEKRDNNLHSIQALSKFMKIIRKTEIFENIKENKADNFSEHVETITLTPEETKILQIIAKKIISPEKEISDRVIMQILEDFQNTMLGYHDIAEVKKIIIQQNKLSIKEIKKNIIKFQKKQTQMSDSSSNLEYLECLNKEKQIKENNITYFKTLVTDSNEITCCVCLSIIKKSNMCITKCGHMFCHECILETILHKNECPACRQIIASKDLYKIHHFPEKNDRSQIIECYGSQIYNIIKTITHIIKNANDKYEQIIIYTSIEKIIDVLPDILKNYITDTKYFQCCGGNITKQKVIDEYNKSCTKQTSHNILIIDYNDVKNAYYLGSPTNIVILDNYMIDDPEFLNEENIYITGLLNNEIANKINIMKLKTDIKIIY